MDNHLAKIIKLSKVFNSKIILNEINLDIRKGEIYFISGSSGEGKTTFLKILSGTENYEGKIETFDTPLNDLVAYVPQQNSLWENMTVLENITFYRRKVLLVSENQSFEDVKNILSLLQISHLINRFPAKLSQGEHQRVALARALATDRTLFLLDEVTANLDNDNRLIIFEVIKSMLDLGKSFVFITHDLYFVKLFQNSYLELKDATLKTKILN